MLVDAEEEIILSCVTYVSSKLTFFIPFSTDELNPNPKMFLKLVTVAFVVINVFLFFFFFTFTPTSRHKPISNKFWIPHYNFFWERNNQSYNKMVPVIFKTLTWKSSNNCWMTVSSFFQLFLFEVFLNKTHNIF